MLTYASQPADDWGPARKENQCGRYESLNKRITEPTAYKKQTDTRPVNFNENINNAFDSETNISSRL
jgi:hypothetical protein